MRWDTAFALSLIPRYPFTETDRNTFRRIFLKRDGKEKVQNALDINELGGYWYVEKEKQITRIQSIGDFKQK